MNREALKRYAVSRTFFAPTDLTDAIGKLGYVQADPIRSPARAQDLILFQRVRDYRADELERRYAELPVFEDSIYNYGFFPDEARRALLPRELSARSVAFMESHRALHNRVLKFLTDNGDAHPREVEIALQAGRRTNGWGGTSSAVTMMLEALHREGRVEVVRREAGIRVYGLAQKCGPSLAPNARAEKLIALIVNLYAPILQSTLLTIARTMQRLRTAADFTARYRLMVKRGELRVEEVDGQTWVLPADESIERETGERVRLLTPFDPLVWDRKRYEHFWGWAYRFEAYTPEAKRTMGYYALPMLWRDEVIGWANVSAGSKGLQVDTGFAKKPPRAETSAFRAALDEEVDRLARFLGTSG
jgi:uncharacterized protein